MSSNVKPDVYILGMWAVRRPGTESGSHEPAAYLLVNRILASRDSIGKQTNKQKNHNSLAPHYAI